jgi:hypothetical protein
VLNKPIGRAALSAAIRGRMRSRTP